MHKPPISDYLICTDPSTRLTPATWKVVVGCKILHFINNEDQEALGYRTQQHTNSVVSYKEIKHLLIVSIYDGF